MAVTLIERLENKNEQVQYSKLSDHEVVRLDTKQIPEVTKSYRCVGLEAEVAAMVGRSVAAADTERPMQGGGQVSTHQSVVDRCQHTSRFWAGVNTPVGGGQVSTHLSTTDRISPHVC